MADESHGLTPEKARPDSEWVTPFLLTLRETANVRAACEAAGVSRVNAYKRKTKHPTFARQWQEAMDDACDRLEAIAQARAESTSDLLMIFLLKSHKPERFRDNHKHEITGADGKDLVPLEALRAMFLAGTENESNGTA